MHLAIRTANKVRCSRQTLYLMKKKMFPCQPKKSGVPVSLKSYCYYYYFLEKVYFRSQILERPSIGKHWDILCVPVLSGNVIFTFLRTCWWHPEANNTGTPKWSSIVHYSCTSIWDLKYTFSYFLIQYM